MGASFLRHRMEKMGTSGSRELNPKSLDHNIWGYPQRPCYQRLTA